MKIKSEAEKDLDRELDLYEIREHDYLSGPLRIIEDCIRESIKKDEYTHTILLAPDFFYATNGRPDSDYNVICRYLNDLGFSTSKYLGNTDDGDRVEGITVTWTLS